MKPEFELVERAIGPVIEIEESVRVWRMPATFGRDFKRIANYMAMQGTECSDMPYAHYLDMDWQAELQRGKISTLIATVIKKWHFFAGIPVLKAVQGQGELRTRIIPAQHYVRGVHHGPYQQCAVTYRAMHEWAKTQGLQFKNEAYEFYVNDPREVEKADIETIILIPVYKK